ncbi:histidine protein methyltransferase 1 homolog [Anolis sagrei]|uniref:histidine protein methyltransferase 1 homolog n=1 Tax=Anolis sagrei TaxID=38937 RepID=UPI00295A73C7|nr:histidine protein methyltransferase 1 homolog [Anolis sagrei ordinatus]XP_060620110.1 histidine protein methyltransferase 1 homolog [Anolis sagrei ordinatus]
MEFQFNFSISNEASSEENLLSEKTENAADCPALSENKEEALPKTPADPASAKEHAIPSDVNQVLEDKIVESLPTVQILVVETAVPDPISSHSDLIPGVYEGGLKIWECTFDLLNYLSEAEIQFGNKSVLDLGCGAGLLGIAALKRNAGEVHFQDYNSSVIEEITLPNILVNCAHESDAPEGNGELPVKHSGEKDFDLDLLSKCRLFSGEWSAFSKLLLNSKKPFSKYDLILTSETVYNPDYYEALHDTLADLLGINGCVYLAGKAHYFGCGGGTLLFTKFIEEKNVFKSRVLKVFDKGLKRFIIELVFKNSL